MASLLADLCSPPGFILEICPAPSPSITSPCSFPIHHGTSINTAAILSSQSQTLSPVAHAKMTPTSHQSNLPIQVPSLLCCNENGRGTPPGEPGTSQTNTLHPFPPHAVMYIALPLHVIQSHPFFFSLSISRAPILSHQTYAVGPTVIPGRLSTTAAQPVR